jgi:hypothetical protein
MNSDPPERTILAVASEAIALLGALDWIRKCRLDRALELLEGQVDICVESLSALSTEIQMLPSSEGERELLTRALRHVREYRRNHPRRAEADLSMIDKNIVASTLALQERVHKILEELN